MDVTAAAALAEIANVLALGDRMASGFDKHTDSCLDCADCRTDLRAVSDIYLDDGIDDDTKLGQISALFNARHDGPPNQAGSHTNTAAGGPVTADHLFGQCASCEGCRFEFEHAGQIAKFAAIGLHVSVVWGPGHTRETMRDHDTSTCTSCQAWIVERAAARKIVEAGGLDADELLGSDDYYLDFDHTVVVDLVGDTPS